MSTSIYNKVNSKDVFIFYEIITCVSLASDTWETLRNQTRARHEFLQKLVNKVAFVKLFVFTGVIQYRKRYYSLESYIIQTNHFLTVIN